MNGSEGWNGGVCVRFALLANHASFNIFAHKRCQARPPELGGNELVDF